MFINNAKTIRILVYPNITYQKDLLKDSYIDVVYKMILALNKIRDDLFFYMLLPRHLDIFDNIDNIETIIINVPTHPNQMRIHFDSIEILEKLPDDIDIIFSHLPEHTLQLTNLIFNQTNLRPLVLGYCHWFELAKITSYSKRTFNQNILGLLEMQKCYVNTKYQKQLVLNEASEFFNPNIIEKLNNILDVFYLGINLVDIKKEINQNTEKIICFNHRPCAYKYFDNFLSITDKLYQTRKDFLVWIPLLEQNIRPYIINNKYNKKEYYQQLQKCRVGFAPKQKYGGWSIASIDGISNGLPYIWYKSDYYFELFDSSGDCFRNSKEALLLLNKYLDNNDYRNVKAEESLQRINDNLFDYMINIKKISFEIDKAILSLTNKIKDSSLAIKKMVSYIKENGSVSKNELCKKLKWGPQIPFTYIKRKCIALNLIEDTKTKNPIYSYIKEKS